MKDQEPNEALLKAAEKYKMHQQKITKQILKKVYEDGRLFGVYIDFEEYYRDEFEER